MQVTPAPVKHDLDYAVTLARYYHRDQFIGGSSYFDTHTSLVIEQVFQNTSLDFLRTTKGQEYLIVAALHDILDNSACKLDKLSGFSPSVVDAVVAISKTSPGEPFESVLARLKENKIAFVVKGHELVVNLVQAIESRNPAATRKYSERLAIMFEIFAQKKAVMAKGEV